MLAPSRHLPPLLRRSGKKPPHFLRRFSPPCLTQHNETPLADAPASFSEEAGLRTVVCGLETKVMALQEQVAQLTLELLRERSERYERRLSSLEALLSQGASLLPVKAEEGPVVASQSERPFQRSLQPGGLRARARVIPRVEMGAAGSYVLICPHEGELAFATNSLEWFEWLCSLSSFRFIGHSGRFTAYREGRGTGEPIALFMDRTTNSLLAPPISDDCSLGRSCWDAASSPDLALRS